jgi:hypothetical protein
MLKQKLRKNSNYYFLEMARVFFANLKKFLSSQKYYRSNLFDKTKAGYKYSGRCQSGRMYTGYILKPRYFGNRKS